MITSTLTYMTMLLALGAAETDSNYFQTPENNNLTTSNGYKAGLPLPQSEKYQTIFGGKYARSIKHYPYMAFIYIADEGQGMCGGTILSPKYVLTAAHCIRSCVRDEGTKTSNCTDRKSKSFTIYVGSRIPEKATQVKVKGYFVHPKYLEYDEVNKCESNYDIAIMKLKKAIKFTKKVSKVKLPTQNNEHSTNCKAVGWGLTQGDIKHGVTSLLNRALMYTNVDVISTKECLEHLKISSVVDTPYPGNYCTATQICTIDPENKRGICSGDSGGPLMCNNVHVAIISMSVNDKCVGPHMPMVYTRVDINVEWINSIID